VVESAVVLHKLMKVIDERKRNPPEKSYTSSLLSGGIVRIGKKILEESQEVVEAAGESGEPGRQHVIREAADVIYHLLVLLAHRDATLTEVEQELANRFGISGIDEKASRPSK
jgi:phosphoribosyl-ATP pyrophosphohydrolase